MSFDGPPKCIEEARITRETIMEERMRMVSLRCDLGVARAQSEEARTRRQKIPENSSQV